MNDLRWKSCNIVVANFHFCRNAHPLTFGICAEHAAALGSDQESFIGCLRWKSGLSMHQGAMQNQLIMLETLFEDDLRNLGLMTTGSDEGNVLLYTSDMCIEHYGFQSVTSLGFRVRGYHPVTLTHVILSSRTEQSYHWVQERNWCTNLVVSACMRPVLCRQGDVCLFPLPSLEMDLSGYETQVTLGLNLVAVDSHPVKQGIIGHDTCVTVLKSAILLKSPAAEPGIKNEDDLLMDKETDDTVANRSTISNGSNANCSPFQNVSRLNDLLKFCFVLLLQHDFVRHRKFTALRAVAWFAIGWKVASSWKAICKIQILPKCPFLLHRECIFDPHQIVFVTSNFLARYGLRDLSWVTVRLTSKEGPGKRRYARVCAVDEHLDTIVTSFFGSLNDDVSYVTPQLWFNLNAHPSALIQPDSRLIMQKYMSSQMSLDTQMAPACGPPFAREVHIQLVKSPHYEESINCDSLLHHYFCIARLLCPGDVFCLNRRDDIDSEPLYQDGSPAVYFCVAKVERQQQQVEPMGCLVDHFHTTMLQTRTLHAYLPVTMDVYFSSIPLHPIWNSPVPCGFTKECTELVDIVLPYLRSRKLRENSLPTLCVFGPSACGKALVIQAVAKQLNLHTQLVNCWELIGDTSGATEARLRAVLQKAAATRPCLVLLKSVDAICRVSDGSIGDSRVIISLKEMLSELSEARDECPILLVGISTDKSLLSSDLASFFLHHIHFEVMKPDVRYQVLQVLINDVCFGLQVSISDLVQKTNGFVLGDLCALISHAVAVASRRITKLCVSSEDLLSVDDEEDICLSGIQLLRSDFDGALSAMQAAHSTTIGAPKIPDVKWEDIGGLEYAKKEILDTVQLPLRHPELLASGLRRSGILLYGPPGTGKTLLAKGVATECSLNFLSVKGPELINMYVGQSEENVRKVFQKARTSAPCIIFFDELDSLAPNRGRSGDSGGVMDRVVSQLLAELDGLHQSTDVFVMAATNRPDLLDSALLRPGRFDKLIYVGITSDRKSQLKILKALTRKMQLSDDVVLQDFVQKCPSQLTGADLFALCSDAVLHAMARVMKSIESDPQSSTDILVTLEDFTRALDCFTPSVSGEELKRYEAIQKRLQR